MTHDSATPQFRLKTEDTKDKEFFFKVKNFHFAMSLNYRGNDTAHRMNK